MSHTRSVSNLPKIIAVVGPTAVGKTAIAVALAESLGGEVVSLDSRQLYRRLDIGTAKPSSAERARARHHLVDVADPRSILSLSDVQAMAFEAIDEILSRGKLPILAGGTGQYVRAVLEGWKIPEVAPDPSLRAELEVFAHEQGAAALHARLALVDPRSAERIDARNIRRVIRAIEIYTHAGEPMSTIVDRAAPPYQVCKIGLERPRPVLYARVDARISSMLESGLETEVRELLADGIGFDLPTMSGLGYAEWRDYLAGEIDLEEVVRLIKRNTRRFIRNQDTWFRRDDASIQWFDLEETEPGAILDFARRKVSHDSHSDAHASPPRSIPHHRRARPAR